MESLADYQSNASDDPGLTSNIKTQAETVVETTPAPSGTASLLTLAGTTARLVVVVVGLHSSPHPSARLNPHPSPSRLDPRVPPLDHLAKVAGGSPSRRKMSPYKTSATQYMLGRRLHLLDRHRREVKGVGK